MVGGVLMAMIFVLSYSFLLSFLDQTKTLSESQKSQSFSYAELKPIPEQAKVVLAQLKPAFQSFMDRMEEIKTQDAPKESDELEKI